MVGGGAIGGITAAGITAASVVVLDANAAHVAKLNDPGLVVNGGAPMPVQAVASVDELHGAFDFALIAVEARCTTSRSRRSSRAAASARSSRSATA